LCVVAVNHILKTIGWLNLHPYLQGFVYLRVELQNPELEQYEADINEIAHNYGPCFYSYHKMFSAKAATAITEHNILINWSKVDDKLIYSSDWSTPLVSTSGT
jgi:hypothetical protein